MRMMFGEHLSDKEALVLGEEKEQIFRELFEHHLRPLNVLRNFLKLLKKAGIKLAVGTSAQVSNMNFILDGLGIRDCFHIAVHQGMVERGKPDPQIYQICMERLKVKPEESLVFEDSLPGIKQDWQQGHQSWVSRRPIAVVSSIAPERCLILVIIRIVDWKRCFQRFPAIQVFKARFLKFNE